MATYIWRRRGRFAVLLLTIAAAITFLEIRNTTPALATSPGDPYHPPEIVDTNPDPTIVETTIIAESANIDIGGGVIANVLTFNGTVPGPIFRLHVGDTVIVHFENHLSEVTGIHWHGIELENASDGTPLTQNQVPGPSGKFLYKFKVPRAGIFWYHPHHHSSTNQVFKGLYGQIIVEDPNEAALIAAGTIPDASNTVALGLSDITVCKAVGSNDATMYDISGALPWVGNPATGLTADQPNATSPIQLCQNAADGGNARDEDGNPRSSSFASGDVPNTQPPGNPPSGPTSGPVNEGQTVITNGVGVGARGGNPHDPAHPLLPDPVVGAHLYPVLAGQGLRLQVGNTATIRFFRLRLTDDHGNKINLLRIGGQGGLIDHPQLEGNSAQPPASSSEFDTLIESGEILLDPGDRADLVAAIPATATSVLTLWTEDTRRAGSGFSKLPTVPVAHFSVTGVTAQYSLPTATVLRTTPVETLAGPFVSLLDPTTFSPAKPGMVNPVIQLTNASMTLGVNGVQGKHDVTGDYTGATHEASARFAASLGDRLELQVTNATPSAHHPFHLHGFSMQPVKLEKSGSGTFTYPPEFKDNVDIPPGYTLTFRIRLDDRPLIDGTTMGGGLGRWVFHCHIFFHATFGMISEFVVSAPDGKERPYVNANDVAVNGHVGDSLTMHGKFVDTDGESVSLSASIGTVSDDGGGNWTWTYTAVGGEDPFVYILATDAGGRKDQAAFALNINRPPVVTVSDAAGDEGAAIPVSATATDPDGDPLTHTWSYSTVSGVDAGATCSFANPSALNTTIMCTDDGTYKITLTVSDGVNSPVVKNGTLTVSNVAPTVTVTSPPTGSFYIVGTTVAVLANVTDPGSNDTQTCAYTWDGGGANSAAVPVAGVCTKSNTFTAAGVYTVSVTATDDDGGVSVPSTTMIVIFDPNAGFITGGGTIDSPAGALAANLTLAGQANVGLNVKYQKGTLVPSGDTEFQFQTGNLNFHVTGFDWLVVTTNGKAEFRGSGTINGGGNYGFLVIVVDGKATNGPSKFRIKIWDKNAGNAVVYDNVPGASEDIDLANPQPVASGSIVVH